MPNSSYPRRGHPIAPQILHDILNVPIPLYLRDFNLEGRRNLCDLDATVWEGLYYEGEDLGAAVINRVSIALPGVLNSLGRKRLPTARAGTTLDDLELEKRTYNCLALHLPQCKRDLQFLGTKTLGQVMKLPAFGSKCLVDLLSSLEGLQESRIETSIESEDTEKTFHDQRLGLLLGGVDEAADTLRERAHRMVWLLHSGYDIKIGADEMAGIWQSLDELMQSATVLETIISDAELRQQFVPPLDERLTQLAQEIAAFPQLSEIKCDDVRLSPLLNELMTEGQTLVEFSENLLRRQCDPVDCEKLKARLELLCERMKNFVQQSIEEELQSVLEISTRHWRNSERKLEVLGWRYGHGGNGGHTLEECGEHFQVSRERIRQICQPCETALENCSLWLPTFQRATKWLEEQTPLPLDEIGSTLKAAGMAHGEWDLRSLRRIARLLQREVPLEIHTVGEMSFVYSISTEKDYDVATQIFSRACRQISRWGVATFEDIAATLNEKLTEANSVVQAADSPEVQKSLFDDTDDASDSVVDAALVESILSGQSDFVLLDATAGWFYLSSVGRNGLLTQVEKVLAVAPRVSVATLRAGVSRHHKRQGFAPPRRVLVELCRQLPDLGVEGDEVFLQSAINMDEALSPTEKIMADVLREHGPVMSRAIFEEHCMVAGIPRGTFYTYLMHSPILEKYALGVYGLRGAHVEPGFIETLAPKRAKRQNRVLTDFGWVSEGKAWLAYTLSEGMAGNGVCSIPSAMKHHIEGIYSLWASDGAYISQWTCGGHQAWSLKSFLRRRGGEVGDILILTIDLAARKVVAELGDESLLEEYQETQDE